MQNVSLRPDQVRDPFERNVPGLGLGRDGCRTPMQWDASRYAGFSDIEPWLPLPDPSERENVETQRRDGASLLQLYRRLIELRRTRPALLFGAYRPIAASGDLLMFVREFAGERLLIALNLGGEATTATVTSGPIVGRWALSSHLDRGGEAVCGSIDLRPHEGAVIEVFPR